MNRTKISTSPARQRLIQNVNAYHRHLKDQICKWPNKKLIMWCHSADRYYFGFNLNIYTSKL